MLALRKTLPIVAVIGLIGCREKSPQIDSDLARDIALASEVQQRADFVPRDTAMSPEPEPRPVETRTQTKTDTRTPARTASAPARRPTPQPVSRPQAPRPEQPTQTVEREPLAAPAPTPAPVSRAPGFLAGTSFGLVTKAAVCTNGNRPGDKIVATLNRPVSGESGAFIPAGASVVLEVASVNPGDTPESASIVFRVRSIIIDGQPRSVDANVAVVSDLQRTEVPREGSSDKKKVIGGAIAGALIGQVLGKDTKSTVIGAAAGAAAGTAAAAASKKYDACLPAGSEVRVTTTEPITLTA